MKRVLPILSFAGGLLLVLVALVASSWLQVRAEAAGLKPVPAPPAWAARPRPITTALVVTATSTPLPGGASAVFLGVPKGDAYGPIDLVTDEKHGIAYVYSQRSEGGGPVVSAIDLAKGQVTAVIPLGRDDKQYHDGRLLYVYGPNKLYVVDSEAQTLSGIDAKTGVVSQTMADVRQAALDEAAGIMAVAGDKNLRAYRVGDLGGAATPLWTLPDQRIAGMAGRNSRTAGDISQVLVSKMGPPARLVVYNMKTGESLAANPLPDAFADLAAGPEGQWAIRTSGPKATLTVLDKGLKPLRTAAIPEGRGLYYDAPRNRYLVPGYWPAATGEPDRWVLAAYDANTLRPTVELPLSGYAPPDRFAPDLNHGLLSLSRFGNSQVDRRDVASLQPGTPLILGVQLQDMALDEFGGTLYVADNQRRVHLVDTRSGTERAVWGGEGPLALDTTNRRLYVNRDGRVVALDSQTGNKVAEFAQGGVPAADPERNLVYIADAGITIYDRQGRQLGKLEKTFPIKNGFVPNPYAYGVAVNPITGQVVAFLNNGIPGSNNGSYAELYAPASSQPITVPGSFQFVQDVAFDPDNGRTYLSYGASFKSLEAVQVLDPDGRQERLLRGRYGYPALDVANARLYLATDGLLTQLSADDLALQAAAPAPAGVDQLLFDQTTGQFYLRDGEGPRLFVQSQDQPPALLPAWQPVDRLPAEMPADVQVTGGDKDIWIYDSLGTDWYRSRDGRKWQKLQAGSVPVYGGLTLAGPRVLFRAGEGPQGGDGAMRSTDDGTTWKIMSKGLVDLRAAQPVVANSATNAYYVGRRGGIMAWREQDGRWAQVFKADTDYSTPGALAMAPDGTLFLLAYEKAWRSSDGGKTWKPLTLPGKGGRLLGFAADGTHPYTLYAYFDQATPFIAASRDGGATWRSSATPPELGRYIWPFDFQAAGKTLYLYASNFEGAAALWRSTDEAATWQAADPRALKGTYQMALAPDGTLWLAVRGGVRSVNPLRLTWSQVGPSQTPVTSATPAATGTPTPTATPLAGCARTLPEREAALAASYPALGCPKSGERVMPMARQGFEHGLMVWESGGKTIFVMLSDGRWQRLPDRWQEGMPESDPSLTPAAGLRQPVRGFGMAWRVDLKGSESPTGWAIEDERGTEGAIQEWEGGTVLRFGGEKFVLFTPRTWEP